MKISKQNPFYVLLLLLGMMCFTFGCEEDAGDEVNDAVEDVADEIEDAFE